MPPHSRGPKRLGPHSYSTPNLPTVSTIEPFPPALEPSKPPHPKPITTFTAGAPSEPVSPEEPYNHHNSPPSPAQDFAFDAPSSSYNAASPTSSASPSASPSDSGDETTTLSSSSARRSPFPSAAPAPKASLYSYSASRSQPSLTPAPPVPSFAPPFYNRPPTPLPPSPSLTSLLRPLPTFSTTSALTSRPTTPDSSDTEAAGAGSTAAAVARSARTATTVPRASPKVPTYEYYGFVLYLGSSALFGVYLLWSYLPTPFLHRLGIYYYPDRWWSLAVPGWLVMALCWVYVALAGYNTGWITLGLGSLECVVDEKGMVAVVDAQGRIVRGQKGRERGRGGGRRRDGGGGGVGGGGHGSGQHVVSGGYGRAGVGAPRKDGAALEDLEWKNLWNYGTDAVMDIPIGGVCEILYGSGRDVDEGTDV